MLRLQEQSGSRLGDIAISEGLADYRSLYEAVAEQHDLSFVNLLTDPPDASLLVASQAETYLHLRALPWRREGNVITVAVAEISDHVLAWVRKNFNDQTRLVITSPFDIRRTVEKFFSGSLEQKSRNALWQHQPVSSARFMFSQHQQQMFLGAITLAIAAMAWMPIYAALVFIILCHVTYTLTMLFKLLVFTTGIVVSRRQRQEIPLPDDRTLPLYTVLIPMYRETASLPGMLRSMQQMDYPASKLDIKLVLEADDKETLAAALALRPCYHFDIIRVPPSEPRTKPKACNYALKFARGEYVTVYDADDRPEPQQLKKAVAAFRSLPQDIVCLQARLNYYNANDNLLTRFFSLEYTILFHFMLYALERLDIPIPLGGTSNHIALARLKELGEWDPYNVTEDADLGVRLSAFGLRTRMIDSYTMEEAPNRSMPWIRQRSRWIKGYMQTWLVHMRRPQQLWRTLGPKGFIGFQFFVGLACFTFLTSPVVWALSLLWLGKLAAIHQVEFPAWLAWITAANLAFNILTHWYLSLYSALLYRKNRWPLLQAGLLYPLYLVLHSIASYKALWQLVANPHFWEKTTHGLARCTDSVAVEGKLG